MSGNTFVSAATAIASLGASALFSAPASAQEAVGSGYCAAHPNALACLAATGAAIVAPYAIQKHYNDEYYDNHHHHDNDHNHNKNKNKNKNH